MQGGRCQQPVGCQNAGKGHHAGTRNEARPDTNPPCDPPASHQAAVARRRRREPDAEGQMLFKSPGRLEVELGHRNQQGGNAQHDQQAAQPMLLGSHRDGGSDQTGHDDEPRVPRDVAQDEQGQLVIVDLAIQDREPDSSPGARQRDQEAEECQPRCSEPRRPVARAAGTDPGQQGEEREGDHDGVDHKARVGRRVR